MEAVQACDGDRRCRLRGFKPGAEAAWPPATRFRSSIFISTEDVFAEFRDNPALLRSRATCEIPPMSGARVEGCDAVIHLACISNDPSFDLNPDLGKSINYDCFRPLVKAAKDAGVKRFIYASSSSVYGIKKRFGRHRRPAA